MATAAGLELMGRSNRFYRLNAIVPATLTGSVQKPHRDGSKPTHPLAKWRASGCQDALLPFFGHNQYANEGAGNTVYGDKPDVYLVAQYRSFGTVRSGHENIQFAIQPGEPAILGRRGEHAAVDLSGCERSWHFLINGEHRWRYDRREGVRLPCSSQGQSET